jgi:hypothetical protein
VRSCHKAVKGLNHIYIYSITVRNKTNNFVINEWCVNITGYRPMVMPKPPSVTVEVLHRICKLWVGGVANSVPPSTVSHKLYYSVDCWVKGSTLLATPAQSSRFSESRIQEKPCEGDQNFSRLFCDTCLSNLPLFCEVQNLL